MGDLETHMQSCDYVMVQCTNECYVDSEPCMVIRKDLSDHLANECSKRQSKCQYCSKKATYADITVHLKTCTTKLVRCPNQKCTYSGSRFMMESHREVCLYERVPCRYAKLGCSETPRRKDIKKHEEHDERNLRVPLGIVLDLMDKVTSLEGDMLTSNTATALEGMIQIAESKTATLVVKTDSLESRMVTLENGIAGLSASMDQGLEAQRVIADNLQEQLNRQGIEIASSQERAPTIVTVAEAEITPTLKHAPCTFKMTSFQEHKRNSDTFCSPSFYTFPRGYKMHIEVRTNGSSDGIHVSVSACLTEGDYDDSLTWPLNGTLTLELLNQLEDKNHHKKTIHLVSMVTGSEQSLRKFISHPYLDRKGALTKSSQYLKNDSLTFRVSVQIADYKPWLECTI